MITTLTITNSEVAAKMTELLQHGEPAFEAAAIAQFFGGLPIARNATVVSAVNEVQATATLTGSGVVATDTVTINGITMTCVASGASGNQWNVGLTDAATMTALAARLAVLANAAIVNYMTISDNGAGVLTLTAIEPGITANLIALAQTGNHIALSAGTLTGGSAGTQTTYVY